MENKRLIASVLLLICVVVAFVGADDTLQERPKRQLLGALLHGLSHGGGGHGGHYGKFYLFPPSLQIMVIKLFIQSYDLKLKAAVMVVVITVDMVVTTMEEATMEDIVMGKYSITLLLIW